VSELAERIEARASELATAALEEMYANPFWDDRFGERGRSFALQDGLHHLNYLVESLRAQDPELLVTYARWLQGVLTTRGMCSRHLDENFARLARLIGEQIGGAEQAIQQLQAARDALRYTDGPARIVQDQAEQLADETARLGRAQQSDPSVEPASLSAGEVGPVDDRQQIISYLADALALGRTDSLSGYLRWSADFGRRQGRDPIQLRATCDALAAALGILDPDTVRTGRAVLQAGCAVLDEAPS
jgi:hypothetical protein